MIQPSSHHWRHYQGTTTTTTTGKNSFLRALVINISITDTRIPSEGSFISCVESGFRKFPQFLKEAFQKKKCQERNIQSANGNRYNRFTFDLFIWNPPRCGQGSVPTTRFCPFDHLLEVDHLLIARCTRIMRVTAGINPTVTSSITTRNSL
jgi:hypothetical protein